MQHELIVYWPDRKPTTSTFKTKMAAMEEVEKARLDGATHTEIRLVSSGM